MEQMIIQEKERLITAYQMASSQVQNDVLVLLGLVEGNRESILQKVETLKKMEG